jgi:hypothetical protein
VCINQHTRTVPKNQTGGLSFRYKYPAHNLGVARWTLDCFGSSDWIIRSLAILKNEMHILFTSKRIFFGSRTRPHPKSSPGICSHNPHTPSRHHAPLERLKKHGATIQHVGSIIDVACKAPAAAVADVVPKSRWNCTFLERVDATTSSRQCRHICFTTTTTHLAVVVVVVVRILVFGHVQCAVSSRTRRPVCLLAASNCASFVRRTAYFRAGNVASVHYVFFRGRKG